MRTLRSDTADGSFRGTRLSIPLCLSFTVRQVILNARALQTFLLAHKHFIRPRKLRAQRNPDFLQLEVSDYITAVRVPPPAHKDKVGWLYSFDRHASHL